MRILEVLCPVTGEVPPKNGCYQWMFRRDGSRPDSVEALIDLREGVEDLPETAATFRINDLTDYHHSRYTVDMVYLVGSWPAPNRYNSQKAARYVNPNYVHRLGYSDLYVECECGAQLGPNVDIGKELSGGVGHSDTCSRAVRERAMQNLNKHRREWLITAADLWMTQEDAARRMGISRKRISALTGRVGVDWQERRKEGRQKQVKTWLRLHDKHGFQNEKIGRAFGRPESTVSAYCSCVRRGDDI